MHKRNLSFCVLALAFMISCSTQSGTGCEPNTPCIPESAPHPTLSDYNLFKGDMKQLQPIDALLRYDLNTELFSDYAQKERIVYIPSGKTITVSPNGELEFPMGSVLVKSFLYNHNLNEPSAGRRILETRLLTHRENGWSAETYVWNDAQNEATLHQTGETKRVSWIDESETEQNVSYRIPSVNDCSNCHGGNGKITPLGPTIQNLNKSYQYNDGQSNQITRWQQSGFLHIDENPSTMPKLPVWNDPTSAPLDQRARAYLHVNCASCHKPSGSASNSALFLDYDRRDPFHLGICKTAIAAGKGSGGLTYNIVPGEPEESILHYRMNSDETAIRMPEIGRELIHKEGVKLIRDWIENMDMPACKE